MTCLIDLKYRTLKTNNKTYRTIANNTY